MILINLILIKKKCVSRLSLENEVYSIDEFKEGNKGLGGWPPYHEIVRLLKFRGMQSLNSATPLAIIW